MIIAQYVATNIINLLVSKGCDERGGKKGDKDDDDCRNEAVVLPSGEADAVCHQANGGLSGGDVAERHLIAIFQNLDHLAHVFFLLRSVDVLGRVLVGGGGDGAVDVTTTSAERRVAAASVTSSAVSLDAKSD